MNQIYTLTLILLLIVLLHFNVHCQRSENRDNRLFKPNSLSGSLGFAGLVATATVNIERIVTQSPDKSITATFAKAGYGVYASWGDTGKYAYVQYGLMTGKRASHFEVAAGPNFAVSGDFDWPVAAFVGYRFQKPEKHFMMRTGIALPETFYFGLGLAF